jgi:hypothetical protein
MPLKYLLSKVSMSRTLAERDCRVRPRCRSPFLALWPFRCAKTNGSLGREQGGGFGALLAVGMVLIFIFCPQAGLILILFLQVVTGE